MSSFAQVVVVSASTGRTATVNSNRMKYIQVGEVAMTEVNGKLGSVIATKVRVRG